MTREERAAHEIFVIMRADNGFSIYSPSDPKRRYHVTEDDDGVSCTCPDFQSHQDDPGWRCTHILAVDRHVNGNGHTPDPHAAEERRAIQDEGRGPRRRRTAAPPAPAQLVLKRSISPDGRIDSLSVELATPVPDIAADAITTQAVTMLAIQGEIVDRFLQKRPKLNGATLNGNGCATEDAKSPAAPARVVGCGAMDGRWGRRLFLTVEADGKRLRFFGSRQQLSDQLLMAGYPDAAQTLSEGQVLDLPCRIVTKPPTDGGYVNVDRLLPANGAVRS